MKICFVLLLIPATALARDHNPQAGLGMAILMGIGVVVWVVGAMLLKAVFGKKSAEKTTASGDGDEVKPEEKNHSVS